jgi:hypothetical protein
MELWALLWGASMTKWSVILLLAATFVTSAAAQVLETITLSHRTAEELLP